MTLLGATIHFGSRTQAVVALSSAESELYAIGTAAQEVLHAMNFIKEAMAGTRVNVKNTYRFNERQEHSNKNRQQQESKAH
jgi:predicted ATPase